MSDTGPSTPDGATNDAISPAGAGDEGLRERKKRLTRRAIHEAALGLVAERGLDQVTTEEIAAAADVSPRTFFNYFPTKDAAVMGLPPDLAESLGGSLLARPASEDLFTATTAVVRDWFVRIDDDPLRHLRRRVVGEDPRLAAAMISANRDLEAALVRAAARRTTIPDPLTARVMVAAVLGSARATYVHAKDADAGARGRDVAVTLDRVFALLARGFAPE